MVGFQLKATGNLTFSAFPSFFLFLGGCSPILPHTHMSKLFDTAKAVLNLAKINPVRNPVTPGLKPPNCYTQVLWEELDQGLVAQDRILPNPAGGEGIAHEAQDRIRLQRHPSAGDGASGRLPARILRAWTAESIRPERAALQEVVRLSGRALLFYTEFGSGHLQMNA